jgi:hypothetical protein
VLVKREKNHRAIDPADEFESAIYNDPTGAHDAIAFGETIIPLASQPQEN